MGQGPEELRAEIERTRAELAADADALADKVNPRKAVRRTVSGSVESTKSAVARVKDRVMGVADTAQSRVSEAGSATGSGVSGAASGVSDAASQAVSKAGEAGGQAVDKVRSSTEGSPLAAGAVAFALGWLAASLVPATEKERVLAGKAVEAVASGDGGGSGGGGQLSQAVSEVVDNLKEPATEAAQSVAATAKDAARSTAEAGVQTARSSGQQG